MQLIQLNRQQDETSRQLKQLDDVRRVELLRELQDSQGRLAEIRAKLQGIGDKLEYTSLLKSRVARGNGPKPEIAVIRKNGDARERLDTTEDTELQRRSVEIVAQRRHCDGRKRLNLTKHLCPPRLARSAARQSFGCNRLSAA